MLNNMCEGNVTQIVSKRFSSKLKFCMKRNNFYVRLHSTDMKNPSSIFLFNLLNFIDLILQLELFNPLSVNLS